MTQYKFDKKKHCHSISKDGKTWEALYGTTTLINEIYPPPLAWYGSRKALEPFGFTTGKIEPDTTKRRGLAEEGLARLDDLLSSEMRLDEYITFLETCYKNHDSYKKSRGKAGTDKHELIEKFIKSRMGEANYDDDYFEEIQSFVDWADRDVDHFIWSEACCYSEVLFCGGITDFGFVHKNGQRILGDAKPAMYHKHFIQTAAYGFYIRENGTFTEDGKPVLAPMGIDGYCIFDYEKGVSHYLGGEWVKKMEADFIHTVEMYKRKDLTGTELL